MTRYARKIKGYDVVVEAADGIVPESVRVGLAGPGEDWSDIELVPLVEPDDQDEPTDPGLADTDPQRRRPRRGQLGQ